MTAPVQRDALAQQSASKPGRLAPSRVLVECLAIAVGYVALGWLGDRLRLGGDVVIFWPAAGFALAALLARGNDRWPGVFLGSCAVAYFVLDSGAFQEGPARAGAMRVLSAGLTGAGRALSTLAGAWLVERFAGTRRWPRSPGAVLGFALAAGVVYPALATLPTGMPASTLLPPQSSLGIWRELWLWFVANSMGSLILAPLILATLAPPVERPHRSRAELWLLVAGCVVATLVSMSPRLVNAPTIPLVYPLAPLMFWATVRFGARGAALSNALFAALLLAGTLFREDSPALTQVFAELHARLAVFATVVLALAAAFEERYALQQTLERERQGLEAHVSQRTQELAHFVSLLHSSLESTADGLLVVDVQGRIVATNRRFSELWGIPASILEGGDDERALAFVIDQLSAPESFRARVQHLYAHPELESEDELLLKDGRVFERFSQPQRLGDEIVGRVWSFRDVTLRRRTEAERNRLLVEESRARQEVERAFAEAQAALAMRDDFLQVAAHEMKTPVTSMKLRLQHVARMLSGASRSPPDFGRLQAGVEAVLRPMQRFEELSETLLDVRRLDSGQVAPHYEALDFREVVETELSNHRDAAQQAGSPLQFDCAGPIAGESDRRHVMQIIAHLLSNAIKFGAGNPLTVRLEGSAERVLLQVIDRGIGIAAEDQERIFGRFERAVDSRHYGGLGLGLWVVQRSAAALGGALTVHSELGQGSTFSVLLPRMRPGASRDADGPGSTWQHG